jgi:hypothetical protein
MLRVWGVSDCGVSCIDSQPLQQNAGSSLPGFQGAMVPVL